MPLIIYSFQIGGSESAEDVDKTDNEEFVRKINQRRTDVCESVSKFKFNKKRVRVLTDEEDFSEDSNGVVYWMSRDQRVQGELIFVLFSVAPKIKVGWVGGGGGGQRQHMTLELFYPLKGTKIIFWYS